MHAQLSYLGQATLFRIILIVLGQGLGHLLTMCMLHALCVLCVLRVLFVLCVWFYCTGVLCMCAWASAGPGELIIWYMLHS